MSDPFEHMSDGAKHVGDALSVATLLGALVNFLPSIAAALTIVWTVIRIAETETVRSVIRRWKNR